MRIVESKILGFFLGVAWICGVRLANAGETSDLPVEVSPGATGYAVGGVNAARHSSDGTQYIYCTSTLGSSPYMSCSASDSAGNLGSCFSFDSNFINAVPGINSASYVHFEWDSSGTCIFVFINHGSQFLP